MELLMVFLIHGFHLVASLTKFGDYRGTRNGGDRVEVQVQTMKNLILT